MCWVCAGYVGAWCGGGAGYLPTRWVGERYLLISGRFSKDRRKIAPSSVCTISSHTGGAMLRCLTEPVTVRAWGVVSQLDGKGGRLLYGGGAFSWDGFMLVIWGADDKIPAPENFFETLPLHFEFFPDMLILACAVATSSLPGRYACERVRHPNRLGLYGPHEFSAKRSPRGDGLLKTLPRIDGR